MAKYSWFESKAKLSALVVLELILLYVIASLAIDSGSLFEYFIGFVLLYSTLQTVAKIVKLYRKIAVGPVRKQSKKA